MAKPWIYTTNFILAATENSMVNAVRISKFHLNALHLVTTDTSISAMYTAYAPLHKALDDAYTKWSAQIGVRKGNTLTVKQLLDNLTDNLQTWDLAIQGQFRKGTATYAVLFPQGHAPFHRGTQEGKKEAVANLALNLADYPSLDAVKTYVTDYLTALNKAQTAKSEAFQNRTNLKAALLQAILVMATKQLFNFATLLAKYINTPTKVDAFYDLKHIQNHKQTDFSRTVGVNKLVHIVRRTLAPDDKIRINNTGDAKLRFFFTTSKTADAGPLRYNSEPGTNVVVLASTLGNIATDHFLNVFNLEDLQEGSFELELL